MAFWKYSFRGNGFSWNCFSLECYLACVAFRKCFLFLKLISFESVSCYGYFVQGELWVFFVCIFQNAFIGNLSFFLTLSCCNYVTERCGLHIDTHPGILWREFRLGAYCYGYASAGGRSHWFALRKSGYAVLQVRGPGFHSGYVVFAMARARRQVYRMVAGVVHVSELLYPWWSRVCHYAYEALVFATPVVPSDCFAYGAWATLLCHLLGLHDRTTLWCGES